MFHRVISAENEETQQVEPDADETDRKSEADVDEPSKSFGICAQIPSGVAEQAARRIEDEYMERSRSYLFRPISFETLGTVYSYTDFYPGTRSPHSKLKS